MPFNTFGVATAVTPSVIETYFSHYLHRKPLKQKPTAHISYHEGLRLIRQFLDYSAKHSVEDLQAFTAQWVPVPTWVRTQDVEVPPQFLTRSANVIRKQLGSHGLEKVGGEKWWQWRRPESALHAEWIEMKKDHNERKREGRPCDRVILYVHGGAYYFGSVDEHRYQMQRHARKLKARVLAPRYRLAPQFPFPCGLYDCIATYFYLLEHFEPSQILFAGDSAGGGMVLSMLVTLRDQGCPLPAGTILLSPWVDLAHSFPSVAGDGVGDYIPPHGFHHKPSMAWPPPPTTDEDPKKQERKFTQPVDRPFDVVELPATDAAATGSKTSRDKTTELTGEAQAIVEGQDPNTQINQIPGMGPRLEIAIDDKLVIIRQQFQMYAKNDLLAHPLVSPVQQPSLGGLPPMLIQVGGAELLRDEQIYLAHKAANPRQYPPSEAVLDQYDPQRTVLNQYPGTDVQLQVWEDLCHVPHTLSFTRPAKYMYRSVAQFGAWALARAQNRSIEILDDDAVSIISDNEDPNEYGKGSHSFGSIGAEGVTSTQFKLTSIGAVGKAGDDLPPFKDHMIRQRVNRHGVVFPLPLVSEIACLHLDRNTIGAIKSGPVRKWLAKRAESEQKFASEIKKLQKKKLKEMKSYDKMEPGEHPPAAALVNRRTKGSVPGEKKKGKSWGLAMWSGWGSSHDESTIQREEQVNDVKESGIDRPVSKAASTVTLPSAAGFDGVKNTGTAGAGSGREAAIRGSATNDKLAVPLSEADEGRRRRRSSASVLTSPWSSKSNGSRSPYRRVKDEGQATNDRDRDSMNVVSPLSSDSASGRGFWDLSRRSSAASMKVNYARPLSTMSTGTLMMSNLNPNSKSGRTNGDDAGVDIENQGRASPTLPAASQARERPSSISEAGKAKGTFKVPGSDNTYLNAGNSRPHNGVVAYPFKVKSTTRDGKVASPDASTTTLDSVKQPDSSRADQDFEMPNAFGVVAHELPTSSGRESSGSAGHKASLVETPVSVLKSENEIIPAPLASQSTTPETNTIKSSTRPVSGGIPESTRLSDLDSPEEDIVGPLEPSGSSTHSSSFKTREYRSRDSRLGQLGADGMPTQAWPDKGAPVDSATRPTPAPFKIRNPVFDARVSPAAPVAAAGLQSQQPVSAPFKMRHTIYDTKVAPVGSKPPGQQSEQIPSVHEMPATNGRNAKSKKVKPQPRGQEPHASPSTASRVPSSSESVAVRASKAPPSSAELGPAHASKQVNLQPTLDHQAAIPLRSDETNGKLSLNNPLMTTSSRPTASRNSSTGPPPTPPPKDTPPTSPPSTAPIPALPSTSGVEPTNRLSSSSNIIEEYLHFPSTREPGHSSNEFPSLSENLTSAPSSSILHGAGSGAGRPADSLAAEGAAASKSVSENPDSIDLSVAPMPKKELPPGAAAAQAALQAGSGAEQGPTTSPLERSAGPQPTAPLPSLPISQSGPDAATTVPKRQESLPSATKETTVNIPTYIIGDLSFEHDPGSPMESDKMERAARPHLETFVTANEGMDLKAMTTGNKT